MVNASASATHLPMYSFCCSSCSFHFNFLFLTHLFLLFSFPSISLSLSLSLGLSLSLSLTHTYTPSLSLTFFLFILFSVSFSFFFSFYSTLSLLPLIHSLSLFNSLFFFLSHHSFFPFLTRAHFGIKTSAYIFHLYILFKTAFSPNPSLSSCCDKIFFIFIFYCFI